MKPAAGIRSARLEDLAAVLALEATFPGDRMSARSIRRFIRSPGARVLVAERDGIVVGALVLLLRRDSAWARIYSVVVHPDARGAGLGGALVDAAERDAARLGRKGLSLEVREDNAAARSLYHRLGYTEARRLPAYYEDGAPGIRLQKPFSANVRIYR